MRRGDDPPITDDQHVLRAAVHRTIMVVDVEGFGDRRRTNPHQVAVREGLYRALHDAFGAAGIVWVDCWHEDRGDGVFILAPAELPKGPFVEVLPHALAEALRRHNGTHRAEERIRLRMALHAGEVTYDRHGVTAASINLTFRLLEAPALKTALAGSPGVLTLIASEWFFDEVVRNSPVIDAATFRPARVTVKETSTVGWICRPDQPYPSARSISGPATLTGPSGSALRDMLAETADQLAQAVGARWRREEEQRKVHDPFPLPVRWKLAPEDVTDHWANICRAPAGNSARPLALTGQLDDIANVYRRIPSGRLVVLGQAGSGKSILTLRFVLDLLATRARTDTVPVIFSLGSWNPATTSLRDWLISQLMRDFPGLATLGPGRSTLAAALVEAGWVLPVLDGFDELADGLHRAALEALNATTLSLLLTSRTGEYTNAVAATDVLTSAAAIELTDLTLTDLVDYLPRTTRPNTTYSGQSTTTWDPVLTWLTAHPTSPHAIHLTAVLSTPLMVALARTVYSDTPEHDPAELLDDIRFPTPDTLREHLFGVFLPAVYQRPPTGQYSNGRRYWGPHRARHHLTYLAIHLSNLRTYDLAWWELGNTLPRRTQILAGALTYGLAYALAYGLVGLVVGPPGWLVTGVVYGLAGMVGGGLALGLAHDEHKPAHIQPQLPGRRTKARKGLRVGLVVGLLLGTVYGVLSGLGNGLQVGIVFGAVFGLTVGLVIGIGIVVGLATPRDVKTAANPTDLLASDRKNTIRQLLVAVGVIGTAFAVAVAFFLGVVLGVVNGVALGVAFGTVVGLGFNAWGWWLVLARIWLPLTGRLPWRVLTFLDDAYRRGVLRQAGAVYQFRHARLQAHLIQTRQAHRDQQPTNS